jgi:hypothetical protein
MPKSTMPKSTMPLEKYWSFKKYKIGQHQSTLPTPSPLGRSSSFSRKLTKDYNYQKSLQLTLYCNKDYLIAQLTKKRPIN